MNPHLQVMTTLPDRATAERIARLLVERRLAACAQLAGPIASIYRWQGEIETAEEWTLVIKTRAVVYAALESLLRAEHPYDVPEIVATPIIAGSEAYLRWIDENTAEEPS